LDKESQVPMTGDSVETKEEPSFLKKAAPFVLVGAAVITVGLVLSNLPKNGKKK